MARKGRVFVGGKLKPPRVVSGVVVSREAKVQHTTKRR